MKYILVSEFTFAKIAQRTSPGATFKSTATKKADGRYEFPVQDDTYKRLEGLKSSPSESLEDVILRVFMKNDGSKPS